MTHSLSQIIVFIFITILFSINIFPQSQSQSQSQSQWKLKKDRCGIKVWTQKFRNSSVDKYRVEGFIEASPESIVDVLMNFSTFSKWHDGVKQAKTLKKLSNVKSIAYMEFDLPWPVRNRDSYAYSELIENKKTGSTKVTIKQLKKQFKTKNIRVAKSEGFWLVTPKDNGAIVTQEMHAEPGGALPGWIVNTMISKGPYKTIKGLRRFLKAKECY